LKTADQFELACRVQEKAAAINSKGVTACLEWLRACEPGEKDEAGEMLAASVAYGLAQVVGLLQMLR
jgi:hypothetical protein